MVKSKPGERVAIQLDSRIALEAIILYRLHGMPNARRQEWLRGLLVQGFRQECQDLRGMSEERRLSSTMAYAPRLASVAKATPREEIPVPPQAVAPSDKPFAALRKVIG
ncbi:MAG: hypothetical protein AAES65_11530 [Candidatus Thiodiazotropha sp. (ex. Lucinoma kazani)]